LASKRRRLGMYALFRGEIQIAGTFPTVQEVLRTAMEDGLIPEAQLPADYHIERVEEPYDPQPDWKLPKEIS
jgi:hypothetical protein